MTFNSSMKRINSNSWKRPFDGDIRPSQDSAYNSSQDRIHNSQCMEFSQISTQDLFGQHSQSQNEQSNQKMSMYEKWLNNRSLSSKSKISSTPKGTEGLGRPACKITPSSSHLGFGGHRSKADDRDEQRELLEMLMNSSQESKQEIKSLVYNLQEMLEKIGGSFNNETKTVLSSFMEDIAKNHDSLVSHLQANHKNDDKEKDLENHISSVKNQIASLESKLSVLEDQIKKTETDGNKKASEFQEGMKSSHQTIIKKLEKMTETLCYQNDTVSQCRMNIENLTEQNATIGKGVQTGVKESETKIMKELKRLPTDLKNTLDVTSIIMSVFEGLPIEIERSLKTKLQAVSRDIKDEFSREHKRYNEQVLRKQFDKIANKMNSLATEHKKIQQIMTSAIHDSITHPLKEIDQCVRHIKDNSSSDAMHVRQMQQSIAVCQDEQSQHLQNMITQHKEISEQIRNVLKNNSINYTENTNQDYHHKGQSPSCETVSTSSNISARQDVEVNERNGNRHELNFQYHSVRNGPSPSNQVIHKVVDAKVNNIHMPVINQTNIHPSSSGHDIFKTPYLSLVNNSAKRCHAIIDKPILDNSQVSFSSSFKRPIHTYSKCKPSPVATIKPQSRQTDENNMTLKEITFNKKELLKFHDRPANNFVKSSDVDVQQNHQEINDMNLRSGYWLRRRNDQMYCENEYIRETPKRTSNTREVRHNPPRSNTKRSSYTERPHGGSMRQALHECNGSNKKNAFDTRGSTCTYETENHPTPLIRKRHYHEQSREKDSIQTRDMSVYDFEDDDLDTTRQKLSSREIGHEERTSVSSVALTINLDWADSPLMKRKKQGTVKSDFFLARNSNEDYASSILDVY